MVFGLSADLDQAEGAVGVEGCGGEHFEEIGLADVVGAGAGDEDASGAEHFEGAEIEFFIAAEGGVEIALGLGEGGWVEDDRVVAARLVGPTWGRIVLEQVEGVGFDPFDFVFPQQPLIQRCILIGDFEGGTRAVDAGDVRTMRGEVKGESALVAEDVESLAVGVLRGGGVVFALVEEGPRLLAFEGVEAETDGIHGERGGSLFALQQAGGAGRQGFEFADPGVDALDDGGWAQAGGQFREDGLADGFAVHGLGEDLEGKNVVVAVDDQAGEEVGFAEDEAIGLGVADESPAVGNSVGNALAKQGGEIRDRFMGGRPSRKHADGDLRRAGIERRAQVLAAVVGNADERAGEDAFGGDDIGAVDPDVAGFEAGGSAGGNLDGGAVRLFRAWFRSRFRTWGHGDMVMPGHFERESASRMRANSGP